MQALLVKSAMSLRGRRMKLKIGQTHRVLAAIKIKPSEIDQVAKWGKLGIARTIAIAIAACKKRDDTFATLAADLEKVATKHRLPIDKYLQSTDESSLPDQVQISGKDFRMTATEKAWSARQNDQSGDAAFADSSWGQRVRKQAFQWFLQNKSEIERMTFREFISAVQKAVGKYPHTYSQMD